jgi:hypothetical protein
MRATGLLQMTRGSDAVLEKAEGVRRATVLTWAAALIGSGE